MFLTASVSRYPLEGYRERCETKTVLGGRHGAQPLELSIPITIAGMSFGALSATAKEALGRAASAVGTSTTTGDGGMTPEERKASSLLVYQVHPSRYGFEPADLRQADAVEIVIGQGAKPGGGGLLLGQKVNEREATMRTHSRPASTSARPVVIRTGSVPTTFASKSRSYGKPRNGPFPSTSKSERPVWITT